MKGILQKVSGFVSIVLEQLLTLYFVKNVNIPIAQIVLFHCLRRTLFAIVRIPQKINFEARLEYESKQKIYLNYEYSDSCKIKQISYSEALTCENSRKLLIPSEYAQSNSSLTEQWMDLG